jgi:hypothetical protein
VGSCAVEVRDHLDDLVAGHAILERLPKMERKLVAPRAIRLATVMRLRSRGLSPGRRHTSSNRTLSLISVRRGAMSPHGARIGVLSFAMASFPFKRDTI